ncbi:hypothetical protein AGMMS49942_29520 [Spirochaetia bacterium]|nr:hypothetical protein AGMMS49942_29520 [Spirochaetia bacterium]
MRSKDPKVRYDDLVRHQRKKLQEYAAREIVYADDLLQWYKIKKREIPDDEYRAVAFWKNREWVRKPGALNMLYDLYVRVVHELPEPIPEIAFDCLAYRFRVYAVGLRQGGFD